MTTCISWGVTDYITTECAPEVVDCDCVDLSLVNASAPESLGMCANECTCVQSSYSQSINKYLQSTSCARLWVGSRALPEILPGLKELTI